MLGSVVMLGAIKILLVKGVCYVCGFLVGILAVYVYAGLVDGIFDILGFRLRWGYSGKL